MLNVKLPLTERMKGAALALFDGTRIGNAMGALFNRYEGAQPNSPDRSWIPAFVRDARFDANSFARWELTRKILYFERNVWLVQKLKEVYTKYVVGPNGLQVMPASSDSDWNDRMRDAYLEWCQTPVLDSNKPISYAHKMMAGGKHITGEMFVVKTGIKAFGRGQTIPKIQLIESHRCATPGTIAASDMGLFAETVRWSEQNDKIIDGVQIDDNGAPFKYWMRRDVEGSVWDDVDARNVIHVGMPERVGMYRYVTPYHAVLNTTNDLDDLEMMEMQRAKANAEDAKVFTTWNGEMDLDKLRRERGNLRSQGVPSISNDLDKRVNQYRTILGSRAISLRPGEDLKLLGNPNPTAQQQWYYRFKITQVCAAVGIPILLVWPDSIQGTVTRAILDDANLFFRGETDCLAHAAREIYWYFADWARYNIKGLNDLPGDWKKCHVVPPRACNVDVGRNSAAKLAEVAAGFSSYDDEANAGGSDSTQIFLRKARNIAAVKKIAKQVSEESGEVVTAAEIASPIADVLESLANANLAQAQADAAEELAAGAKEEIKEPITE